MEKLQNKINRSLKDFLKALKDQIFGILVKISEVAKALFIVSLFVLFSFISILLYTKELRIPI